MDLSFFNKNNSGKNNYIGMEIDDYEIRAVELDLSSPVPKLCKCARIKLEAGTVTDGIVKNPSLLALKLTELWSSAKLTSDRVLLGIGSQDLLIRFAKVPKMEDSKIKNLIRYQSQDYFPVAITDYEMDFMTLNEKTDDNNQEFKEIVIVASKSSHIKGYTSSLETAKLSPYEIDISSLSLMKYAEQFESDSTAIMVNIAYGKLDLLILKNYIPVFAKTATFDATSLFTDSEKSTVAFKDETTSSDTYRGNREISDNSYIGSSNGSSDNSFIGTIDSSNNSSFIDSNTPNTKSDFSFENTFIISLEKDYGISDQNTIGGVEYSIPLAIQSPMFLEIYKEIQSLVNYCLSLSDTEYPSVILLCGPCSRLEGLDHHISSQTMIKTILLEPFKDILVPENLREEIGVTSTDFSVCTSLAARGLEV